MPSGIPPGAADAGAANPADGDADEDGAADARVGADETAAAIASADGTVPFFAAPTAAVVPGFVFFEALALLPFAGFPDALLPIGAATGSDGVAAIGAAVAALPCTGDGALTSGLGVVFVVVVATTGAGTTGSGRISRTTGDTEISSFGVIVSGVGGGAVAQAQASKAAAMMPESFIGLTIGASVMRDLWT